MGLRTKRRLVTLMLAWTFGAVLAQEPVVTGSRVAPELMGSYVTGPFTIEEIALMIPELGKDDICGNTGTFIMDLRAGGWSLNNYPMPGCTGWNPALMGSWRVLRNNVLEIQELVDLGCGPAAYTYNWQLDGDTLTLTALNDPCTARIYFFTARPWRKVPNGAQPQFQ